MAKPSKLLLTVMLAAVVSISSVRAQATAPAQTTSPNLYSNSTSQVIGPTILPETPGSVNGGNPFQGLGRPDDTGPLRTIPIQQYSPGSKADGLFSSTSSFPSTTSVEQPGFGGQAGFSSNNTSSTPGTVNPALNQSSIPALNQAPGETNPGPNGALQQNLVPMPQQGGAGAESNNQDRAVNETRSKSEKIENETPEGAIESVDKLLRKPHANETRATHRESAREANVLAAALKEMHRGDYKKCLETVDTIIKKEPKNAQAYYVKAVTNVLMRDFRSARQNYEMTLSCSTDERLTARAKAGLQKLGR